MSNSMFLQLNQLYKLLQDIWERLYMFKMAKMAKIQYGRQILAYFQRIRHNFVKI